MINDFDHLIPLKGPPQQNEKQFRGWGVNIEPFKKGGKVKQKQKQKQVQNTNINIHIGNKSKSNFKRTRKIRNPPQTRMTAPVMPPIVIPQMTPINPGQSRTLSDILQRMGQIESRMSQPAVLNPAAVIPPTLNNIITPSTVRNTPRNPPRPPTNPGSGSNNNNDNNDDDDESGSNPSGSPQPRHNMPKPSPTSSTSSRFDYGGISSSTPFHDQYFESSSSSSSLSALDPTAAVTMLNPRSMFSDVLSSQQPQSSVSLSKLLENDEEEKQKDDKAASAASASSSSASSASASKYKNTGVKFNSYPVYINPNGTIMIKKNPGAPLTHISLEKPNSSDFKKQMFRTMMKELEQKGFAFEKLGGWGGKRDKINDKE